MHFFKLNRKRQFVIKRNKRTNFPFRKERVATLKWVQTKCQFIIEKVKKKKKTYKMEHYTRMKMICNKSIMESLGHGTKFEE